MQESEIIPTDHQMVSAKLDWFEFREIKPIFKFNVNRTSAENLNNFKEEVDMWIDSLQHHDWDSFSGILKDSMNKYIKKDKINVTHNNQLTKAERTLKKQVKLINKAGSRLRKIKVASIDMLKDIELQDLYYTVNKRNDISISGLRRLKKLLIQESVAKAQLELAEEFRDKIQNSVTNFYKKPKDYIKKALNTLKPKIDLRKVYDLDDNLENDPDLVKDIIAKYFQNILRPRSFNLSRFLEWKDIYSPVEDIDNKVYESVISPLLFQEIDETIRNLLKNKAPGLSGVTYDIIKLLGKRAKEHLTDVFNFIMVSSAIPKEWKKTSITLIPKKTTWSHKLNDTRPISLIDLMRKVFTGTINRRFTKVLKDNKILSEFNFAGLPGQSTMKPLTIVNSVIQAANSQGKEFWFTSLDIAKAFDSAPIMAIKKSLERINCPNNLTDLFINLLSNRSVSVNTLFEATDSFLVNNGVEQGETLSPILWVIFYDLLVTKLAQCPPIRSFTSPNVLAYMDDLALIADSKKKTERLLSIANEFFEINSLHCNKENDNCLFLKGVCSESI